VRSPIQVVVPRESGDPVRRGLSVQSLASLEYWVARSSRAMTTESANPFRTRLRILAARCVRGLQEFPYPPGRGCGNAGRLMHPQLPTPNKTNKRAQSPQIHQNTRRSARNGLRLIRALPGDQDFLTPSPADKKLHRLDADLEASGPHDFAIRFRAFRQGHIHVHRIPPHVS
jgi:hypothetical protein